MGKTTTNEATLYTYLYLHSCKANHENNNHKTIHNLLLNHEYLIPENKITRYNYNP